MAVSARFLPRKDYFDFNLRVGEKLADTVLAAEFPETKLRFWNDRWAERVGLGDMVPDEKVAAFAKFRNSSHGGLPGIQTTSLAMRYHGHQFRHYNPQLGDGRGFLYAQCEDPLDHRLLDFGTKGSGQTPYSRAGDGRLTLKGAVREALATEMLEALGVVTSKTFAFFETGESLERSDEPSPTRAAVLTRLSHGHIRFGSFQRLAATGEVGLLRELLKYSIDTYFPDLRNGNAAVGIPSTQSSSSSIHLSPHSEQAPFLFLERVIERMAELAASWMIAGFVHGVLNTDNMNITGESFDYGPWRFLPFYDPAFTAAYFDREGLYSYSRQPESVYWNLEQLARALFAMAPEGDEEAWRREFVSLLEEYPRKFQAFLIPKFFKRMGLTKPSDETLAEEVFVAAFGVMKESKVPFEEFFYDWYGGALRSSDGAGATASPSGVPSEISNKYQSPAAIAFTDLMRDLLSTDRLQDLVETATLLRSEYYRRGRPESMLIDEVEAIWSDIDKNDDWSRFHSKIQNVRERGKLHGFGF